MAEISAQEDLQTPEVYPWLRAGPSDLADLDFEAPIAGTEAADCGQLADFYRASSQALAAASPAEDTAQGRVWAMLWALTGFHFKPVDVNEPFGPMMVLSNGNRSAIPSDFGEHVDMLASMANAASSLPLKARLCDVCWLLDRKRAALGKAAITTYLDVIRKIEAGELKFGSNLEDDRFRHETHDYLLRALGIARTLGWDKPEALAARQMVVNIRRCAVAEATALTPVLWFSKLDLQFGVSDPLDVASGLEHALARRPADAYVHLVVDLLRLTAQAYHRAKRDDEMHRCQSDAAELLVGEAERTPSAMLASQLIANAITELHGTPNARARRLELRHRLIDVQANIPDEMSTYSQEIDLTEIASKVRDGLTPLSLFDSLFVFAVLDASPDPAALEAEARKAIREHPLASLFGAAHLDDEGKVIHRTAGGAGRGDLDASVIAQQVAQAESIRRHVVASGKVEPARHIIVSQHYLSDDALIAVLQFSAFVPQDLVATFSRGFARFFQGDYTSALYILTPLLENSLRHVLKVHGHDVTIFDNATQTQQDRTISSLYEQMRPELEAIFTTPIIDDIDRVFLAKPGPYLRHAVAHGLLHDGGPYGTDAIYGCWLIFRLCLLPLVPCREQLGLK